MMPSAVFRSFTFPLAGCALLAVALTTGVAAQDATSGQRSGATPAQGRSSSPARSSTPSRAINPSAQEAQPRAKASPAKQRAQAEAEPNPAKPATAKPSTAKPAGSKAASTKPVAAPAAAPGAGAATLLATFDDWGAYATQAGRSKVCYALSQPTERTPKSVARDPAYLFVSFRPSENVRNEIALVMGFPTKDGGEAQATIGSTSYGLVTKGANAWVKNPAEESQVISTMSRGSSVTVKATSGRGNATSDRYSLKGFAKALEKARDECKPGGGA